MKIKDLIDNLNSYDQDQAVTKEFIDKLIAKIKERERAQLYECPICSRKMKNRSCYITMHNRLIHEKGVSKDG